MEPGFLLNNKEKEKLKEKLRNKIKQKQEQRKIKPTKQQQQREIKLINGDFSSENIYNHVLYLMKELEPYRNEKNRLKVAKKFEKKHNFLYENFFNIYREVCYGRLNDLRLLQKLLRQRDLQMQMKQTEEDSAKEVGKILTEKFVKE